MRGSYPSYEGVPHMRGSWNSQYCFLPSVKCPQKQLVFTCFKMNSQTGITSRCGDYMGIQEASSILIFFFQHKPKSRKGNVSPRLSCQNMWVWLVIKFSGWGECAVQMLCFHFLFLCNLKKYSQQRGNFLLSQGRKWHRKEVKWCFLWLLRLEVNIHAGSGDRRGGGNITVYTGCSALSQCYTGHTRHKPVTTL